MMNCNCGCNVSLNGICDVSKIKINSKIEELLNWVELTNPRIVEIPEQKPDVEDIDSIYVSSCIQNTQLVKTPFAYKSYRRLATDLEVEQITVIIENGPIEICDLVGISNKIIKCITCDKSIDIDFFCDALSELIYRYDILKCEFCESRKKIECLPCLDAIAIKEILKNLYNNSEELKKSINNLGASFSKLLGISCDLISECCIEQFRCILDRTLLCLQNQIDCIYIFKNSIKRVKYLSIISNEEGEKLTGRKLFIEGILNIKIVYTALVKEQSLHTANYQIPFSTYIILYPGFEDLKYEKDIVVVTDECPCEIAAINGFGYDKCEDIKINTCELFNVEAYVEDAFACTINNRKIFEDVMLFIKAKPIY